MPDRDLGRAAIGAFPEAFGAISRSAFGGAGRERTKATAGSSPGRGRVMTCYDHPHGGRALVLFNRQTQSKSPSKQKGIVMDCEIVKY